MTYQRLIPGGPLLNETSSDEYLIPGGPAVNATVSSGGAHTIAAATGVLSITGQTATVKLGAKIVAAHGSLALTGQAASLRAGYRITAAYGSISISGQDASLSVAAAASGRSSARNWLMSHRRGSRRP